MNPKQNPSEAEVTPQILQAMTASGCHLYRNNRGVCKYGPAYVRYGVGPNGAGDFIGFLPVRITQDMIGHVVAVFCSTETKRPQGASYAEEQVIWRDTIRAAGGIAGFVDSWETGRALVMDFWARFKPTKKVDRKIKKA